MSLNKYMHPRNRYRNKPSFLDLALKYPEFRKQVTQDESGKVFLDFKNADALRALTTCLLKEDFDLTVHLPSDRLVPTLPLRLNYIHWLEDIIGTDPGKWGIDIGTGASCVYPLLAAKVQKWNFLATEADPENFYHAKKNIETNDLQELIHVKQVSEEDALYVPLESFKLTDKFDFCMCNPPFFADIMEAQAVTSSRSLDRPEAQSMSTASPQECIAQGGEVGFVRQLIEESTLLRDKIRVYSSMVGKKTSLTQLKEELRHQKITKFATTNFCQGRTMRWGIAWSFDDSINFPKSQFETRKDKPPLQFVIPKELGGVEYKVHAIAEFLKGIFASLKIHCFQGKAAKSYTSITLTAVENTWCHQRRKRRQQKRQEQGGKMNDSEQDSPHKMVEDINSNVKSPEKVKSCADGNDDSQFQVDEGMKCRKRLVDDEHLENEVLPAKVMKLEEADQSGDSEGMVVKKSADDNCVEKICEVDKKVQMEEAVPELGNSLVNEDNSCTKEADESPKDYILKCVMRLKRAGDKINMELDWLDGTSRELMHQIKTFLINKLGEQKTTSK